MYPTSTGSAQADPPVRLAQFVSRFTRNSFENVCMDDLTVPVTTIASKIRNMIGDTCLARAIAMPADCVVTDTNSAGTKTLPVCGSGDCYKLNSDPTNCPAFDHLRVDITRAAPPPADTVTSVRCVVP
jgi:hypothetical protein